MDCPHCQGRFGAHVPGCPNAGKSSEHMEVEHLRDNVERLKAENKQLEEQRQEDADLIAAQKREIEVLHGIRDEAERLREEVEQLQWVIRDWWGNGD